MTLKLKARYKTGSTSEFQLLSSHLEETGMFVELFAKKIGLPKPALLTALVHDLGKGSKSWQAYLDKSIQTGKKIDKKDHGTAGGQFLYQTIKKNFGDSGELTGQLLAACVMYHHGCGLPDVIKPDGTAQLYERLEKPEEETHAKEAAANLDEVIREKIEAILSDNNFVDKTMNVLGQLTKTKVNQARYFYLGLTARFLSSCLIDGDRRSSAMYERGMPVKKEETIVKADWTALRKRLEDKIAQFPAEGNLNVIRRKVSGRCAAFAEHEDGIFTLTAATGSGKTLASLRYALVHAEKTGKEHVYIIAPYTSILDQTADVIRGILEPDGKNDNAILIQHSNLEQSEKTEHFFESSETWNVPIIITTMVQFLEALFGSGTRKIRRMHQLANSVIVFDEVQTLPVACTYLFTWAIQYLRQNAGASILLCTATQPGLNQLKPDYALPLSSENEIIADINRHFEDLKRVDIIDKTKSPGWTLDETAKFAEELDEQSILIVVNTKSQARKLYKTLMQNHSDWHIIHLSANMCPAHRRKVIAHLKEKLRKKTEKCVCVSTRLIEAGVDIDFDSAIRFFAGFDSIIQTAGRCNRNGELKNCHGNSIAGKTYIINIVKDEENISPLPDLIRGQDIMYRILREFHDDEKKYNHNLLHPDLIARYFHYYYGEIPDSSLKYKMKDGRDDTLIDLLSDNTQSVNEYQRSALNKYGGNAMPLTKFRQSYESAWSKFEVIASDTIGVIVPFEKGGNIIAELYSLPDTERCRELLRDAQQYSVNVYYSEAKRLCESGKEIIRKVPLENGMEIYTVDKEYYNQKTGLSDEKGKMTTQNV
jgi:CRISPR-associated endonuclease/helicase Cas3